MRNSRPETPVSCHERATLAADSRQAVTRLFPGAKVAIGPAIVDGFYYDFDLPDGRTFSDDDLARIEDEMRGIVKADQHFERSELTYDDALALFADQPYKQEIIEKVRSGAADAEDAGEAGGDGAAVSVYRNVVDGDVAFVDLCRGPHVPSTGKLGAFKLLRNNILDFATRDGLQD